MTIVLRTLAGGVSALALGLASAVGAHAAETSSYRLAIGAKPLPAALAEFAAATGVTILRAGGEGAPLAGRSRPVSGRYRAEDGLRAMLEGSGLIYSFSNPRSVTVYEIARDVVPVQLAGEVTALDEISVTGESGLSTQGAPDSFTVTAADIARKNPSDVKDLFRGEAGVQVGSSIPLSQKVYVRGVEETNLAVSIDGSAQNNKVFHHNATTYIDPGLLKSARVDPGVAPADAGFAALAGSIAYETKDVADLLGRDGDGYGGQVKSWFDTNGSVFGTNFTAFGKKNGFEALGYFNIADGNRFKNGDGDRVAGTATDLISGLGKMAFEGDSGDRFEFSHERVRDDAARPFRANGDIEVFGDPTTRNYQLDRQNTVFNYSDTTPEGWWDPKATLGYSSTRIKVPNIPRNTFAANNEIFGKTDSLNGRFENKFGFALGSVTAGVDFRRDKARLYYEEEDNADFRPTQERMTNVGGYMQARLEPFDRTRLSFGGRADHQRFRGVGGEGDKNHSGLSGNVSGEYDLIPELLTAKAGYSHVWGGIPLAENFVMNPDWQYDGEIPSRPGQPPTGRTGKRLEAVIADNVTAGLVARYKGFTVDGSIFGTNIKNARNAKFSNFYDNDFGGPGLSNFGSSFAPDLKTRGFELGARYDWETSFVAVKYIHIDIDIDGRPGNSDSGNYIATPVGDLVKITAAHTFAQWNVTVGGDVEIAPEYSRLGRDQSTITLANPQGNKFPSYDAYQIVNVFAEWKPQKLPYETTLRVDLKNMFDETYSDRASYGSEFGNVTPLFEPGRSVLMSAAVKF